jgi:hypothetical protein
MDLIVTIDTEADNQWKRGVPLRCENVGYWQPFQRLFAAHGVVPTYLITSEMAEDECATQLLRAWVAEGQAEVGAHLHPWTTPPYHDAPGFRFNDETHLYPSELPESLFRAKLDTLTAQIVENVGVRPLSYRAGRFGISAANARILRELGYVVDSSVTPLTSWHDESGTIGGPGGPDFSSHLGTPFLIAGSGEPGLLELPVTVEITNRLVRRCPALTAAYLSKPARAARKIYHRGQRAPQPQWLRPRPKMRVSELGLVWRAAEDRGVPAAIMMFHSSELMPGGSPYRPTRRSITGLYATLDDFFHFISAARGRPASLTAAATRVLADPRLRRREL